MKLNTKLTDSKSSLRVTSPVKKENPPMTNQSALTVLLLLFTFLCVLSGVVGGAFLFGLLALSSYLLSYLNGNAWKDSIGKK